MQKIKKFFMSIDWKKACHAALPYILLLIATLLPFRIYLQMAPNIPSGDDINWHIMWTWDLAQGFKNGYFLRTTPSHYLLGNLGVGTYLFYGPLCHYSAALLSTIFPFININASLAIVMFLSFYTSGIWMYELARKIAKDDMNGLLIAILWLYVPYRLNNLFYRAAYPEAFAMGFIPLLFLGIYQIGHCDFRPKYLLCCVLGVSGLLLSHPYTALITIFAALVYLLISYKGLIALFKNKRAIIYSICTVILVIVLTGWYLFPMVHYLNSGIYNVSNKELMWTNVPHIVESINQSDMFSGFLRKDWIDSLYTGYGLVNTHNETWTSWMLDYLDVLYASIISIALGIIASKKLNRFLSAGIASTLVLSAMLFTRREEMYFIVPLLSVLLFISLSQVEPKGDILKTKECALTFVKEPGVYLMIALLVFSSLLIWWPAIWNAMPSIMLNAQFAWRNWSLFAIAAILFIAFVVGIFPKKKIITAGLSVLVAILFLSNMSIVDKRFCYQSGNGGKSEVTLEYVQSFKYMGAQNEYTPAVFRDYSYSPSYENSLYGTIRSQMYGNNKLTLGLEDYITPVFLEGEGSIQITSLNSPEATFTISVTSEKALIQFPQFFYDGYELQCNGEHVKGQNIDGLVSFEVSGGNYSANLKWVGITSQKVFTPLFFVGLAGCIMLPVVPYVVDKTVKRRETN